MTETRFLGFQDGKDPNALRTIGEVAKAFDLRQHVLRYWEEQFPMLQPLTRAGGRRYYRPEDIALIAEISRLLYTEGFTIRGARQALEDRTRSGNALPRNLALQAAGVTPAATSPELVSSKEARSTNAGAPIVEAKAQPDAVLVEKLGALRAQLANALERA